MNNKIYHIYNSLTEYLFYFFLFLLPLQTHYIIQDGYLNGPWQYGTYNLYLIDIILIILFILSIFYKNKIKINKSYALLLITYILISFLSLYWSVNQELGFYYFIRYLGIIALLFIIAKINFKFFKFSWALLSAGLVQAIVAIYQFFIQNISGCKWLGVAAQKTDQLGTAVVETSQGRWLRAYGLLPHPNILAGFLVICLILCVYLYLKSKNNFHKILIIISTIFITAGLFFTFSRSAIISLIIIIIFLSIFIFNKFKQYKFNLIKIITAIFLTFITLSILYSPLVFSRINSSQRLEQKSISERVNYQQQSLTLIKKYWPIGVGPGNYTIAVHDLINQDIKSYNNQPVHNIYLLIFSELGIFGLLIIILIIINSFKIKHFSKLSSLFALSLLLGIMMISLFDHFFWSMNFGLILFFLLIGFLNKNENS